MDSKILYRHVIVNHRFDTGVLPVLLIDGLVCREQVQFVRWLAEEGKQQKTLMAATKAIGLFVDYYRSVLGKSRSAEAAVGGLAAGFFHSQLHGTGRDESPENVDCLQWKSVSYETANIRLQYVNRFSDFCHDQYGHLLLNEASTDTTDPNKVAREYERRRITEVLSHLFFRTQKGKGVQLKRRFTPSGYARRFGAPGRGSVRAFPLNKFAHLLKTASTTRDKLLWLLLAGGGVRISEALHLYLQDLLPPTDQEREGIIYLTDPSKGLVSCADASGRQTKVPRKVFLAEKYGLEPRDALGVSNPDRLGWKGIALEDRKERRSKVYWLLPEFADAFWKLHKMYLEQLRLHTRDMHPYYFVTLKGKNWGLPLRHGAARELFRINCAQIGVHERGIHSLRHFYGRFSSDVLGLEMHVIQARMRHKSIDSTQVYTNRQVVQEPFSSNTDMLGERLAACRKMLGISNSNLLGVLQESADNN